MDTQVIDIIDSDHDLNWIRVTLNAEELSRVLIKLLHSTTAKNPKDVAVTLEFDFFEDTYEIIEEV